MAQATTFPTFVSVDYDKSTGFRDFRADAVDAGNFVKRQFERDMADVQSTVRKALTLPAGASGAFKFDTASMRSAAAEAERNAQALRLVAKAAEEVARETDDNTAATRRNIQATQAAARQAEEEARALNAKAATYERLQDQISRTGAQLNDFAGANRRVADSQGVLRQASIGAGQQLQDIAISLYSGQKAGVVFAQQLPQMAFQLSVLEGSTNKTLGRIGSFAAFLSGPWGLAIGLGVGALATLISSLWEADEAAQSVTLANDALSKSQSVLGEMFDLTTGKIKSQNEMLRLNAQLQAINLRTDAIAAEKKAQDAERDAGQRSWSGWFGNAIDSGGDLEKRGAVRRSGVGFSASGWVHVRRKSERTLGTIEAYTAGAEIAPRRGRWLWIPTNDIPARAGRVKITPGNWSKYGLDQRIGPLVMVKSVNGRPLLVVKGASVSGEGKRRSAKSLRRDGGLRKGQVARDFIVAFIAIPRTSRQARIDVPAIMREAQATVPSLLRQQLDRR